jgi:uncharacterized protein (UPF0303 family)
MHFKRDLNANALLTQEKKLMLATLDICESLEIGEIAKSIGLVRSLPITVEVRHLDWLIYHASLPGSTKENQHWIDRKARVVLLKHHSTMYEKISAEERGVDWHKENKVLNETHAIHGGGLPLVTKDKGFVGALLISGLPQLEDHIFGVEVLTEYLANKGG